MIIFQYDNYTGQETQVWLDYAFACNYINKDVHEKLFDKYDHIISMLVNMSIHPEKWSI